MVGVRISFSYKVYIIDYCSKVLPYILWRLGAEGVE